jgi:hypothetical protein
MSHPYSPYPGNPPGAPKLSTIGLHRGSGHGGTNADQELGLYLRTAVTGTTRGPVNPVTDTWVDADCSTSYFIKGANADVYKNALAARGMNVGTDWVEHVMTGGEAFPGKTAVTIHGASVKHFISFFDQTDIVHGFPPLYIKAIKDVSRVNTRIGFWFHSNHINTGETYSLWQNPLRIAARDYLMVGSPRVIVGVCNGTTIVDDEEPDTWNPDGVVRCLANESTYLGDGFVSDVSGHSWITDFRSAGYAAAYAAAQLSQHNTYWSLGVRKPDSWTSDNLLKQFIDGDATNTPAGVTDAAWGAGIDRWIQAMQLTFQPLGYPTPVVWGNVGDPSRAVDYVNTGPFGQYWEHSFMGASRAISLTNVRAGLDKVKAQNQWVTISYRKGISPSATNDEYVETAGNPEFAQIVEYVRQNNMANRVHVGMFAAGGSGSTDGYLFWQPGMRRPE